jgi:hypothetical protein
MVTLQMKSMSLLNKILPKKVSSLAIKVRATLTSLILLKYILQRNRQKKQLKTTLQWVHITISNAKRTLLGKYH